MTAPLIPQEIYLLERYSSLVYFGTMRDHFAAMIKAAQDALDEFMQHVPPDYRSWHPSQQPDQVWGERIIPNLQWTLDGLNKAYIRISHDDLDALGLACNVGSAFAAISRDYYFDWMPQQQDAYDAARRACGRPESNISITSRGEWLTGALTSRYKDSNRGPLDAPELWPQYRLNPQVRVKSGDKVSRNGIYLPDLDGGCAQLLIEGYEAWQAAIPDPPADPRITSAARKRFDTKWTLVERVADTGGGDTHPHVADDSSSIRLRCEAGQPCPRTGVWSTPAAQGSRTFQQGQTMPDMKADYGQTIWHFERDAN